MQTTFLAKANKIREMTLIIGVVLRLIQVDSVCSTLLYAITSILHRYILPPSTEYTRKHYIILKVFFEARLPKIPIVGPFFLLSCEIKVLH